MRHRKAGRKFGRNSTHRRAMFKNLAGNLIAHERIETTEAKAKELRRVAERLITRAARLEDDLTVDVSKLKDDERDRVLARRVHAQRQVARLLPKKLEITKGDGTTEEIDIVHKLFHVLAPRYMDRIKKEKGGGYTRVVKMLPRKGDNAKMALIEFIDDAAEA